METATSIKDKITPGPLLAKQVDNTYTPQAIVFPKSDDTDIIARFYVTDNYGDYLANAKLYTNSPEMLSIIERLADLNENTEAKKALQLEAIKLLNELNK